MCDSPCLDPTGTAAVQSLKRTDDRPRTTAGEAAGAGTKPGTEKGLAIGSTLRARNPSGASGASSFDSIPTLCAVRLRVMDRESIAFFE
jgi:hypothetical protein